MANQNKFTEEQIEDAIRKAGGFISTAAKSLKCTSKTIYNYIDRSSRLKEVVEEIRLEYNDLGEAALISNVKDKDRASVIFFNKTRNRDRGYAEKQDIDITSNEQPIKININLDSGDNS
tara:strand:- start:909 stop:1265 length:357 start_codon:yes stop_codon:yes gene_type:complete